LDFIVVYFPKTWFLAKEKELVLVLHLEKGIISDNLCSALPRKMGVKNLGLRLENYLVFGFVFYHT